MTTVWVYVDTSKQVGDRDHLKVFANRDAADAWFAENDPEDGRRRTAQPLLPWWPARCHSQVGADV
jgi:hypothetical protein